MTIGSNRTATQIIRDSEDLAAFYAKKIHDTIIIPSMLIMLEKIYCEYPEMHEEFCKRGSYFHTMKRKAGIPYDSAAWTGRTS